jgi:hypothetical protein
MLLPIRLNHSLNKSNNLNMSNSQRSVDIQLGHDKKLSHKRPRGKTPGSKNKDKATSEVP